MYRTHKTYITEEKRMIDLIDENYSLLLLLQHFNIDFAVGNKTVKQLCEENNVSLNAFLVISNLYNGFYPAKDDICNIWDVKSVLVFLRNSHYFYKEDKCPELEFYLNELKKSRDTVDIQLIEQFFHDYFNEVVEHLDYEDEVAFPYFYSLIENGEGEGETEFSVMEYRNHHTDIETKLTDLKNLFLKHINIKNELSIKRKFLNSLFGLEFDLKIHSVIEEKILIPLIERIESGKDE